MKSKASRHGRVVALLLVLGWAAVVAAAVPFAGRLSGVERN